MDDKQPSTAPLVPGARRTKAISQDIKPSRDLKPKDTPVIPTATPGNDDVVVDNLAIDTPQSDEAINDIIAQEADEVLAAQDAGIESAYNPEESIEQPERRGHPIFWFFITLFVCIIIIAAIVVMSPGLSPSFAP